MLSPKETYLFLIIFCSASILLTFVYLFYIKYKFITKTKKIDFENDFSISYDRLKELYSQLNTTENIEIKRFFKIIDPTINSKSYFNKCYNSGLLIHMNENFDYFTPTDFINFEEFLLNLIKHQKELFIDLNNVVFLSNSENLKLLNRYIESYEDFCEAINLFEKELILITLR